MGTGDARLAIKAAAEAQRYLPREPLALLLKAEAAQLAGDPYEVEASFKEMTKRDDMRQLGFRGLHAHAQRRGDVDCSASICRRRAWDRRPALDGERDA